MRGKLPLYRKMNTCARGARHNGGGDYKWSRHAKREDRVSLGTMSGDGRHGRDYTPLYRFLLSRVGSVWDKVHAEAIERLDRADPIFWLVARSDAEKRPFVRIGENTYYSGLYVDESGRLARVAPDLSAADMRPSCACCTHTLDGQPFTKPYVAE